MEQAGRLVKQRGQITVRDDRFGTGQQGLIRLAGRSRLSVEVSAGHHEIPGKPLTVSLPTTFFDMPGHHSLWGAYSSGRYAIVGPQSLNLIPQVLQGELPPTALTTLVRGSWWITYLFDQALWVDPTDKTRSWGVFGNAGISDAKPNPIHWSAIVGMGGSSPLPSRKLDTFGIAYYYLAFSDGFKNVARAITPVRDERGLELFYNVGVTPWCHVTADSK